jgi:hypothetical protein
LANMTMYILLICDPIDSSDELPRLNYLSI